MTDDNIDNLMRDLHYIDSGWHRQENPENGKVGLFPSVPVYAQGSAEQRQLEDEWEQRSIAMHSAQVPIHLKPKPTENALSKIERGD